MDLLLHVAEQFVPQETITQGTKIDVREYGSGNINDTYLVNVNSTVNEQFVLQRAMGCLQSPF